MAYPKEMRESLTDYCNDGHSVREAQEKLGIVSVKPISV